MARELGPVLGETVVNLEALVWELLNKAYDAGYDDGHEEGRKVRDRLGEGEVRDWDDGPIWDWL